MVREERAVDLWGQAAAVRALQQRRQYYSAAAPRTMLPVMSGPLRLAGAESAPTMNTAAATAIDAVADAACGQTAFLGGGMWARA